MVPFSGPTCRLYNTVLATTRDFVTAPAANMLYALRAPGGILPLVFQVLVMALCLASCARVSPYQREALARRDMQLIAGSDLDSGKEHAKAYREGSAGGGKAKAGGCGCN